MTGIARIRGTELPRERIVGLVVALLVTGTAFALGLAFAEAPLVAGLAAVGVLALVVSLAHPQAATYVVIAILYSNAAAVATRHGLPGFVAIAFPLLLALPLGDQLLLRRKAVVITSGLPFLFGYLVVQVLGALGAREVSDAFYDLINFLISGFAMYFVITNVLRSFSGLRNAAWAVLVVAAALGALSTFQAVTKSFGNDFWGFSTVDLPGAQADTLAGISGTPRAQGPIGEKNRYGQIMLVVLPVGAALALGERRRRLRLLALFLTLLVLSGMATSFSRGAAFGLLVVVLVAAVFRYLRPTHFVALALLAGTMFVVFPWYGERLLDLQGLTQLDATQSTAAGDTGNLRGRATATLAAVFVWADHPLVGVGRGQFDLYYEQYASVVADTGVATRIDLDTSRQAHNLYASVAAETGTLGFLCFFGIFLVTMRDLNRARRRWRLEHPAIAHLSMGFFLALVAYLASGIALHLSYERYLWFLLALAGVAAHLALKGDVEHDFEV